MDYDRALKDHALARMAVSDPWKCPAADPTSYPNADGWIRQLAEDSRASAVGPERFRLRSCTDSASTFLPFLNLQCYRCSSLKWIKGIFVPMEINKAAILFEDLFENSTSHFKTLSRAKVWPTSVQSIISFSRQVNWAEFIGKLFYLVRWDRRLIKIISKSFLDENYKYFFYGFEALNNSYFSYIVH